jgi:hypothetical protein
MIDTGIGPDSLVRAEPKASDGEPPERGTPAETPERLTPVETPERDHTGRTAGAANPGGSTRASDAGIRDPIHDGRS